MTISKLKEHNGSVKLIDSMGSDLTVVNAARVSFDKESSWDYDNELGPVLNAKDKKLIKYLAEHKHWCYDDQTEVFTDSGWKLFEHITAKDKVAQVHWDNQLDEDLSFDFVTPDKIHSSSYKGEMYCCESSTVNYCVTPNHKMLFKKRTSSGYGTLEVGTSNNLYKRCKKIPTTATYISPVANSPLDYYRGWLYGFLLADGRRVSANKIQIRLKRIRKIKALREVIYELGMGDLVSEVTRNDEVTEFSVNDRYTDLSLPKKIKEEVFHSKSNDYLEGLLYGFLEGDGAKKNSSYSFSNSSKQLFNDISRLAVYCGKSLGKVSTRHVENLAHKTNYRANLLCRKYGVVNNRGRSDERKIDYSGKVYCVTVPSGMLLVRRQGVQIICGNTPFSHPMITLRIKMPIFVARQWFKHTIGFTRNEVSRRYVDSEPEFWNTTDWRLKPEKSKKQGSSDELADINDWTNSDVAMLYRTCVDTYNDLIEIDNVAPEQARMLLPQSMMTEFYETASLAAYARLYKLRSSKDAQLESQWYASAVNEIVQPLFNESWKVLVTQ